MSGSPPFVPEPGMAVAQTPQDWARVSEVCRHLALVAIDGASDEAVGMLAPACHVHIDGIDTDRNGYAALIEANRAAVDRTAVDGPAHDTRPPLDVVAAHCVRDFVSARLAPRCLAHFRFEGAVIAEVWLIVDWQKWCDVATCRGLV